MANEKRLNILIVTEAFFPDGEGGAHTYIYNYAKFMAKRDNSVSVITLKTKPDLPTEEIIEGINVYRYNAPLSGALLFIRRPFFSMVGGYKAFKFLSGRTDYDIINVHSILPGFGVFLSGGAKRRTKVFTFHASFYQEVMIQKKRKRYAPGGLIHIIFWLIKCLERNMLMLCDRIIVLSEFNRDQIGQLYRVPKEKITVVPGGVDSGKFKPLPDKEIARKRLGIDTGKFILLTVRRLVPRMGIENLLFAMKEIIRNNEKVLLLIGGRGYLAKDIEKTIEKEGLDKNVKLLGYISEGDLVRYYQASDLFILPTEYLEGFGMVTLESMASGLPVIGTPLGGTKEILMGFGKEWLFRSLEPREMAVDILGKIDYILKTKDLSDRCRNYVVKHYLWESIAAKIEEIFIGTLEEKHHEKNT